MTALLGLFTPGARGFVTFAIALTAVRAVALIFGHPNLGPDEAQYWFWSQTPAFGYYSKPPLIAWAIAATTAVFGDAEWAVRLSAPLFQLGAAAFVFLGARRLANDRAAFWAGISWLTLPGVFLSSALMTTDGPLMFFWSAALYFFIRLTGALEKRRLTMAVFLGGAIGLGLLSKYAMVYFLPGAALALILSPARRGTLRSGDLIAAGAMTLALIAPNIFWNAENDFQTLAHTAANANWTQSLGNPANLLKFLGDQLAIAGPIMLALAAAAAWRVWRRKDAGSESIRMLIAFSLPALLIVSAQAFISRAHGNWAAVAYPSAIIAAAIFASGAKQGVLALKASLGLHLVVGAGFLAAFSSMALADGLGASGAFKRLRGWDLHGPAIAAAAAGYDAIVADDREVMSGLIYYARGGPPVAAWNSNARIDSHYEAFAAFDPQRHQRLLYVTTNPDAAPLNNAFASVRAVGTSLAPMTATRQRTLYLFEISGYRPARN